MNQIKQLNIKNAEAYELAAEIAKLQGGSLTDAVVSALREKLERTARQQETELRLQKLMALSRLSASWPDGDPRSADEVIGYDESGVPT